MKYIIFVTVARERTEPMQRKGHAKAPQYNDHH